MKLLRRLLRRRPQACKSRCRKEETILEPTESTMSVSYRSDVLVLLEDDQADLSEAYERITSQEKRVSFGRVTVLEFPTLIGHQSIPSDAGVPLSLGMAHEKSTPFSSVDYYEAVRPERLFDTEQLRLTEDERTCRLLLEGFTLQEIEEACRR